MYDAGKVDCTLTMKDEDFYKLGTGSLNPQTVSIYYSLYNNNLVCLAVA